MSLAKTKTKLTAALCMLLIAAVMMTTASYAWFTISTAPEITDLSTTVVTNETLEIALAKTGAPEPAASTTADAGDQYTWGNIIDLSAVGDNWTNLSKVVRPAQLASDKKSILYPKYDNDGRIKSLDGTLSTGTMANGFGNLKDGDGNIYGYYVDYYMRSNVGGTVTLTTAANRGTEGVTGAGSWISSTNAEMQAAMRVAFQEKGTGDITEAALGTAKDNVVPLTCSSVVTLEANKSTWVRMYVYIDGKDITNKSASIDGTSITGTVNVQFAISGVDKPMPSITEKSA